ncbi:MAG: MerC domain-containing protein [Bdellovibrio sp.]
MGLQKLFDSSVWDQLGVSLSLLCAIHCAVTPIFIFLLPVLRTGLGAGLSTNLGTGFLLGREAWGEQFHLLLALLIVPTAVIALWAGYSHHRHRLVLWTGFFGILLVAGLPLLQGFVLEKWWGALDWKTEALVMIPGSFLLIWAHLLNRRYCRCHNHD